MATTIDPIQVVRDRMVNGDDHVKDVAKALGLTPGKTAFIKMQILVSDGAVPTITGRTPAETIARTIAARKKADEYSSWGWLAARTGRPEGSLKKACEKKYPVFGDRITAHRAAKRTKNSR